jgi:hypothetical protein
MWKMMRLDIERYVDQVRRWPTEGRHILAQFDSESIVVYQAYRPSIGRWAVENQRFGGPEFSFERMSWIKPSFLWMMYRSGWAAKEGQETVLAVRLRRSGFDDILSHAVPSSFVVELYATAAEWKADVRRSEVRLQWDPDHHPRGAKCERRAIQLGLRGTMLKKYSEELIVAIEDVTELVKSQRNRSIDELETPTEKVYPVADPGIVARLGLSTET